MSVRKPPQLTPELLASARRNAQYSTGPHSEAGRQHSKLNALKHGERAAPENHYEVMRALGEDPQRFEKLKQELAASFGPGDALWDQQLEDLAKLYWRRNRIERMETGLMRRALEAVEERQRARRKEIAAATFDPSRSAAIDIDLGQPTDPCVRLRMLLSLLGVLREEVRRRVFKPRQRYLIETYYQGEIGWRPARFRHLLWLFVRRAECQQQDEEELHDFVSEYFEGGEAAVETHYQELLGLLDEEIAEVEEEFRHEVEAQEKRDAIERDACLAPVGKTWETLLRQEMALDRSIDRKIKILLSLWKQHPPSRRSLEWQTSKSEDTAIPVGAALVAAQGSDKGYVHGGPGETPVATSSCHVPYSIGAAQGDSPAQAVEEKSSERTGNVIENKRSTREAAETCQNVSSSARCNSSLSKLRSPQSAAASLSVLR